MAAAGLLGPDLVAPKMGKRSTDKKKGKKGVMRVVGDRKRNFVFLPKADRKAFKKIPFCRNTESTERWSFCRKRLFLPKEGLSAKNLGQS